MGRAFIHHNIHRDPITVPLLLLRPSQFWPNILTSEFAGSTMFPMRTTLTLEPDVAKLVRETIENEHISLKDAINEGLRRGLKPVAPKRSLRIVPHQSALQPGLDPRGFNQLAGEFENEAVVSAFRRAAN